MLIDRVNLEHNARIMNQHFEAWDVGRSNPFWVHLWPWLATVERCNYHLATFPYALVLRAFMDF